MRKIICLLLCCFFALNLTAYSFDFVTPQEKVSCNSWEFRNCTLVINDEIGILTDDEEAKMVETLTPYCNEARFNVMIRTHNKILSPYRENEVEDMSSYFEENRDWTSVGWSSMGSSYSITYGGNSVGRACSGQSFDGALKSGDEYLGEKDYETALSLITGNVMDIIIHNWTLAD